MANNNGVPQLTWANIIGSIIALTVLCGGAWTLFQTQFNYFEKDKEILRNELNRRIAEISTEIEKINRDKFVTQFEFKQYENMIEKRQGLAESRILSMEQTRPTAGELQAVAKNSSDQIDRILNRLDKIENKR